MSVLAQQVITPVITDPRHVQEVFASGPINIQAMGPVATLTFTNVRLPAAGLAAGADATKYEAVVVARISLPLEIAAELKGLLNRTLVDQPTIVSNRPQ